MSDSSDAQYQDGQWASLLVCFIEDRNGKALVRLPNGSKTSVEYKALRPAEAHRSLRPPTSLRLARGYAEPLRDVLDLIYANGFVIDDDPAVEAHWNTYALGVDSETAKTLSIEQVKDFLGEAQGLLAAGATDIDSTPLRFYSWFDEMAGQLRFSVSSAAEIPLGAVLQVTSDPSVIAQRFLHSHYLDGIPWSEFRDRDDRQDSVTEPEPLDVFVVELIPPE